MPTDPSPSLTPNSTSESFPTEIAQALAARLGPFSLRELLALILNSLGQAERQTYLNGAPADKGNGSYARSLKMGSIPLQIDVPRTRADSFRPALLPPPYQRDYPEETQALLVNLLASCRSINAAQGALRKMGLAASEDELESVAHNFIEELELRNTRPLDPDLLALFLDAKYVEVREGDRLRPGAIYLIMGLGRDGKKRVLACLFRFGRENLEEWKNVLRPLIERGLRRVLLVVHDDFSGLLPITRNLFPHANVQLCIVHLQRLPLAPAPWLSRDDCCDLCQSHRLVARPHPRSKLLCDHCAPCAHGRRFNLPGYRGYIRRVREGLSLRVRYNPCEDWIIDICLARIGLTSTPLSFRREERRCNLREA